MKSIPVCPVGTLLEMRTGLYGPALTRQSLLRYQLDNLREQISYARERSRFYRETLRGIDTGALSGLDDLERLPLCSAEDLIRDPAAFSCVPQSEIERVVTLFSSGTSGSPKRVFFSRRDLERTVEFFHWGMSCLADNSDTVLILMPSGTPWSVGDILKRSLSCLGARYVEYGPVQDYQAVLETARKNNVTCMVGIPSQVYRMAKLDTALRPRSVLLSADYVPGSIISLIEKNWQTEVFVHYGLTETGLGGGVECHAHSGCHMRDMEMLFEIVDPATGRRVAEGETGEIVFSTFNREAMPLIRYRTGDRAAFFTDRCPCGMDTARIGRFQGRLKNILRLQNGESISIELLDEAVFALEPVLDYTAELVSPGAQNGIRDMTLHLALLTSGACDRHAIAREIREKLQLDCPLEITTGDGFFTRGPRKREIQCIDPVSKPG